MIILENVYNFLIDVIWKAYLVKLLLQSNALVIFEGLR